MHAVCYIFHPLDELVEYKFSIFALCYEWLLFYLFIITVVYDIKKGIKRNQGLNNG